MPRKEKITSDEEDDIWEYRSQKLRKSMPDKCQNSRNKVLAASDIKVEKTDTVFKSRMHKVKRKVVKMNIKKEIKQEATPDRKHSVDRSGRCPVCQMPFSILSLVETPSWHVDQCLEVPYSSKNECQQGMDCSSEIGSHYKKFRHTQLARSQRKNSAAKSRENIGNVDKAKVKLTFDADRNEEALESIDSDICIIDLCSSQGNSDDQLTSDVDQKLKQSAEIEEDFFTATKHPYELSKSNKPDLVSDRLETAEDIDKFDEVDGYDSDVIELPDIQEVSDNDSDIQEIDNDDFTKVEAIDLISDNSNGSSVHDVHSMFQFDETRTISDMICDALSNNNSPSRDDLTYSDDDVNDDGVPGKVMNDSDDDLFRDDLELDAQADSDAFRDNLELDAQADSDAFRDNLELDAQADSDAFRDNLELDAQADSDAFRDNLELDAQADSDAFRDNLEPENQTDSDFSPLVSTGSYGAYDDGDSRTSAIAKLRETPPKSPTNSESSTDWEILKSTLTPSTAFLGIELHRKSNISPNKFGIPKKKDTWNENQNVCETGKVEDKFSESKGFFANVKKLQKTLSKNKQNDTASTSKMHLNEFNNDSNSSIDMKVISSSKMSMLSETDKKVPVYSSINKQDQDLVPRVANSVQTTTKRTASNDTKIFQDGFQAKKLKLEEITPVKRNIIHINSKRKNINKEKNVIEQKASSKSVASYFIQKAGKTPVTIATDDESSGDCDRFCSGPQCCNQCSTKKSNTRTTVDERNNSLCRLGTCSSNVCYGRGVCLPGNRGDNLEAHNCCCYNNSLKVMGNLATDNLSQDRSQKCTGNRITNNLSQDQSQKCTGNLATNNFSQDRSLKCTGNRTTNNLSQDRSQKYTGNLATNNFSQDQSLKCTGNRTTDNLSQDRTRSQKYTGNRTTNNFSQDRSLKCTGNQAINNLNPSRVGSVNNSVSQNTPDFGIQNVCTVSPNMYTMLQGGFIPDNDDSTGVDNTSTYTSTSGSAHGDCGYISQTSSHKNGAMSCDSEVQSILKIQKSATDILMESAKLLYKKTTGLTSNHSNQTGKNSNSVTKSVNDVLMQGAGRSRTMPSRPSAGHQSGRGRGSTSRPSADHQSGRGRGSTSRPSADHQSGRGRGSTSRPSADHQSGRGRGSTSRPSADHQSGRGRGSTSRPSADHQSGRGRGSTSRPSADHQSGRGRGSTSRPSADHQSGRGRGSTSRPSADHQSGRGRGSTSRPSADHQSGRGRGSTSRPSADHQLGRGRGRNTREGMTDSDMSRGSSEGKRKCPFYKKMPDTSFTVDAFRYGNIPDCKAYILSHFHYDHYGGLTKRFQNPIYCSQITGNLVVKKIGVDPQYIHTIPLCTPTVVEQVEITFLEANHCPGAVLILFKLRSGKVYLHTGDFRAGQEMEFYPELQNLHVHCLYLDTTYCDPQYDFPPQVDVIKFTVKLALDTLASNPKTLIICGSYTIGKERIFMAIAQALNCKVCVTRDKFVVFNCLEDEDWKQRVSLKWDDSGIHVLPMNKLNVKGLQDHLSLHGKKYTSVLAIEPTGWTHNKKVLSLHHIKPKLKKDNVTIYGVPYSEHSSFLEMKRFYQFIKPDRVLPTVNNGNPQSRRKMEVIFESWLQNTTSNNQHTEEQRSVKGWMK